MSESVSCIWNWKSITGKSGGICYCQNYFHGVNLFCLHCSVRFAASIGGIFSLFLGIGFLSTFEIFYFASLRVLVDEWNSRKIRHRRIIKPQPLSWRPAAHF